MTVLNLSALRPANRAMRTLIGAAVYAGACLSAGPGVAQEVRRTELARAPVSGDDTREIVVQRVEIPPGATSGRHYHNGEESFYVLEGTTIRTPGKGDEERVTGSSGINRRGVPHAGYTVVGDRTLRMLSVYVVDKDKPLQVPVP